MEEQPKKATVNSSLELTDQRLIPAEALDWYNKNKMILTAELRRLEKVERTAACLQKAFENDYYLALKHRHENYNYLADVKAIFDNRQVVPIQSDATDGGFKMSYQLSNAVIGDLDAIIKKAESIDKIIYDRQVRLIGANLDLSKARRETKDQETKLDDLYKELVAFYDIKDYRSKDRQRLADFVEEAPCDC